MWEMCEIRERRRRLTHERVCAIEICQPRDGQIQLTIQQSRVPTMTMTTRCCTRRLTHERTKQSALYEDTGNSSPRKPNFPELVERRRHRTSDCRKQGRRGRPEEVISQINHIFLYSSGEADIEQETAGYKGHVEGPVLLRRNNTEQVTVRYEGRVK